MERWLPTALGALALALGLWNAWSIAALGDQMAASVEVAATEEHGSSSSSEARGDSRWAYERRPRYGADAPDREFPRSGRTPVDPTADASDPEFREKVASVMAAEEERRDAERRARFEESITTEVQAFADEEGLDEATTTALFAAIAERMEAHRALRDDMRNGTITWSEGRAEMEELRASGEADAERLLGAERAERLHERLWGDRGGWERPR